jgi:branched-chain amino acid transport system substrate-binding protein
VIADFNSGVTLASEPVYHKANIPQVTNSSNPAITANHYHNLFRLIANDNTQGGIMAKFAAQGLHLKSVASFNDSAAFGVGVSTTFSAFARSHGIKVTGPTALSATSNDYTGALTPILAKHPSGIYFGGVATPGGLLCRQARQLGFTGPIMGPDGLFDPSYPKGCGPRIGSNAYVSFQAPPYNTSAKLKKFARTYKSTFHSAAGPYSLYGYDEMAYLLTAINKAGTTVHSAVNNAGHKITYHSIIGPQRVNKNGQLVNAPIYIYRAVGTSFKLVMKG